METSAPKEMEGALDYLFSGECVSGSCDLGVRGVFWIQVVDTSPRSSCGASVVWCGWEMRLADPSGSTRPLFR